MCIELDDASFKENSAGRRILRGVLVFYRTSHLSGEYGLSLSPSIAMDLVVYLDER